MTPEPDENLELAVRRCAARTFGLDVGEVPPELRYGGIAEWDSVGHVDLMAALEELFGVRIGLVRFAEMRDLPAIVAFVRAARESS